MSRQEAPVYGRRACLAVAERRPSHILRAFYDAAGPTKDLAPLLKACAAHHRPYRAVSAEELERLAGSKHHEGVVLFTERRERASLSLALSRVAARAAEPASSPAAQTWVALDGVENDHNQGAIARTLAWFGAAGLLWQGPRPQLSGAALRVAQGGAEHVELVTVDRLADALAELKAAGVRVVGADQHARRSAFEVPLDGPVCWVLGSEELGLSAEVRARCDELVAIPGAGVVESLNVSVSAAILVARAHAAPGAPRAPSAPSAPGERPLRRPAPDRRPAGSLTVIDAPQLPKPYKQRRP